MTMQGELPYLRRMRTPLEPIRLGHADVFATLDAAYAGMRAATATDPGYGVAWKLGGTTWTTRRVFGVDQLYFGPLHAEEVFVAPARAPGFQLAEMKGEAEIALRVSPEAGPLLAGEEHAVRKASLSDLFDAWCVALELPSSPLEGLPDLGVIALIADRCAAGALVLGPERPFAAGQPAPWGEGRLLIASAGETLAEGGIDALVDTPERCARDFLIAARDLGFAPQPGQWISTGGLTPCVPLPVGSAVSVHLDDVQEIEVLIDMGGQ